MHIRLNGLLLAALLLPVGMLHAQDTESQQEEATTTTEADAADAVQEASATDPAEAAPTEADTTEAAAADTDTAEAATAETDTAEAEVEASGQTAGDPGGLVPAPPAGKGQVVFFREKKFAGAGVRYKVREGEAELGKLSSGTYFIHVTEPGQHEYTVHSEAKDVLNLEVEEGETYYVIGSVTMGFLAGRPNLSPSDQPTFQGMSGELKQAKPLD